MRHQTTISELPRGTYWAFIWRIRANRQLLGACLLVSVVQFGLFKIFYPYPDFFGDSYSYINAAAAHLNINIWPIGYSKFLEGFHRLTYSGMALTAFQYFSFQLVAIHFLMTVLYFYNLTLWHRNVLALFIILNPLTIYLCNTVNSDAIFATVSLLWITELIWVIHWPRWYQIFTTAVLLWLAFTIRNNAYYYPVAGAVAFLLCRREWRYKTAGIALPILLIIPFVLYTQEAAFKLTGTRQFSLFTGWQLANNALYMYDQLEVDSMDLPTPEARELNQYSLQFFRRVNPQTYRPALENYVGNFFIRQPEAPLKQYYGSHYQFKEQKDNIINWARASEVFEPFGKTLIEQHPIAYLEYFVLPNAKHYLIPPLSHVGLYNYGLNEIDPVAQKWFHFRSNKIWVASHELQGNLLLIYIGIFLLLNVFYVYTILRWVFRGGWRGWVAPGIGTHIFILAYLVLNFAFSVVATVNILRYQFVPMLVLAAFGLALHHDLVEHKEEPAWKKQWRGKQYAFADPEL